MTLLSSGCKPLGPKKPTLSLYAHTRNALRTRRNLKVHWRVDFGRDILRKNLPWLVRACKEGSGFQPRQVVKVTHNCQGAGRYSKKLLCAARELAPSSKQYSVIRAKHLNKVHFNDHGVPSIRPSQSSTIRIRMLGFSPCLFRNFPAYFAGLSTIFRSLAVPMCRSGTFLVISISHQFSLRFSR